jgi:hypothetical protein
VSTQRPNVDEIITWYCTERRQGLVGARLRHNQIVEVHLRASFEASAPRVLTTPELVLLAAEQQFQPFRAAARIADPEALLFGLLAFLEPEELLPDATDRREQVAVVTGIAHWMVDQHWVDAADASCVLIDIDIAATRVRRELRGVSSERR